MNQEENDRLNKLTDEEIYQFFDMLLRLCQEIGVYSVIETAEMMGVPYKKVKEWATSNEDWDYSLQICRSHCACHALDDWAFFELAEDLGLKYCLENDDEFAEYSR